MEFRQAPDTGDYSCAGYWPGTVRADRSNVSVPVHVQHYACRGTDVYCAKSKLMDEARRIAANIAKLPELPEEAQPRP